MAMIFRVLINISETGLYFNLYHISEYNRFRSLGIPPKSIAHVTFHTNRNLGYDLSHVVDKTKKGQGNYGPASVVQDLRNDLDIDKIK